MPTGFETKIVIGLKMRPTFATKRCRSLNFESGPNYAESCRILMISTYDKAKRI